MSTARLVALANQAASREAIHSIRVLPPGTQMSGTAAPSEARPNTIPEPEGPVRTRKDASTNESCGAPLRAPGCGLRAGGFRGTGSGARGRA